jgi:beta-glucosidase
MKVVSTPLDFLGLNQYFPFFVRQDPEARRGWSLLPCDEGYPKMQFPWLNIAPSILYWGARLCHDLWHPQAIYITENGCADTDRLTEKGEILDLGRIMYLQNHLLHLQRAAAEGVTVKGYFHWSLMDNFEWVCGYTKRLGLYYVDYDTMKRFPKLSAQFYARVIRRNAVGA